MDCAAVIGGAASHWGGPAAFAELVSAVHAVTLEFAKAQGKKWTEQFHIVNDAGHCENGLYALKANYGWAGLKFSDLLGFRSLTSGLTGHGELHLNPELVTLSNGPLGSTLGQSQGLSLADRKLGNSRTTVSLVSDGAMMEGEVKEVLSSIPGFFARNLMNPFVLVISDNNTKLSGRIDTDSFSMRPSFEALKTLGWTVIELPMGNDLKSCVDSFEMALQVSQLERGKPVALWAKTVKGFGVQSTSQSSSGGHGFPVKSGQELQSFLNEIFHQRAWPSEIQALYKQLLEFEEKIKSEASHRKDLEKKSATPSFGPEDKIQKGVSAALIRAKKKGLPLVSITSDLPGSTGVAGFRKEFPDDSYDVGVAESNMISAAAGFSRSGFIPVVDTFAQFGVTKGALPIVMASLSQAPLIGVFSHTGFQDAADGASHQALNYLSQIGGIPHVHAVSLSSAFEAEELIGQALEDFHKVRQSGGIPDSYFFFLGRENFPLRFEGQDNLSLIHPCFLGASKSESKVDLVMATHGSLVLEAVAASHVLAQSGVKALVVGFSSLNRFSVDKLLPALSQAQGRLVVGEDHQHLFGFGEHLIAELSKKRLTLKIEHLAVAGEFGQSAYSSQDLYSKHHLNRAAWVRAGQKLLINT